MDKNTVIFGYFQHLLKSTTSLYISYLGKRGNSRIHIVMLSLCHTIFIKEPCTQRGAAKLGVVMTTLTKEVDRFTNNQYLQCFKINDTCTTSSFNYSKQEKDVNVWVGCPLKS